MRENIFGRLRSAALAGRACFTSRRYRAAAAIAYLAMAVFTFGHDASLKHGCFDTKTGEDRQCPSAQIAFAAFVSSTFWPLYWSWELQG